MGSVLVTGANSLLGTNVIIELLSRGYNVVGLLRDINSSCLEKNKNLKLIQSDFANQKDLDTVVEGCDFVIHVAAVTSQSLSSYAEYKRVNVTATESLIKLAVRKKVKRFVYISSSNAFGYGTRENPGNENSKIREPISKSFYALSKLEGQEISLSYKKSTDIIIINPTFMIGPYDSKPSSGRIIFLGLKRIVFYPPGGKNFIHVQDVAKGIVNALEKGKNGEAYILANENLSFREFLQKVSSIANTKSIYIRIPRFIMLLLGLAGSSVRLFGIRSELSLTNMKILCIGDYYSNDKAVRELDLVLQPVSVSIKDAMDWFLSKKMIRQKK
jgi:dihydroflavonol-4-reductase